MDADIDKVMSGLDKIVEAAPSYEKLFMRWQRQHWSTEDFDFTEDARQWADPDMFTEEERDFIRFGFSEFFLGEERVTVELLPFALAAPSHEAQVFLTTQISDEAKHVVFWDGFYREVFGVDAAGLGEMIDKQRYVVNKDWETLFDGILHECAERPAQGPERLPGSGPRGHRLHDRDRGDARPDRGPVHDQVAEGARTGSRASPPGSPRSTATSPATSASGSSSSPTRSRTIAPMRRSSRRP